MRRIILATIPAILTLATAGAAMADTQPTSGYASTDRNDAGFGGGPHCHVNLKAQNPNVDFTAAFPSHTGHAHSGTVDGVFAADPNCDGDPGQ
jgi:hypothetical protein